MKNFPFALVLALLLGVVTLLPKGSYGAPTSGKSAGEYKESDAEESKKLLEENKLTLANLNYYRLGIKRMLDLEKGLLNRIDDTQTTLSIDKSESDKLNGVDNRHIKAYDSIKENLGKKIKLAQDISDLLREKITILEGGKLTHGISESMFNRCQCDKGSSSLKCKLTIKRLVIIDTEYSKHHASMQYQLEKLEKFCCDLIKNIRGFMIISYNLYKGYENRLNREDLKTLYKKHGRLTNPANLKTCDDLRKTTVKHTHEEKKKPTAVKTPDIPKVNVSETKPSESPSTSKATGHDDASSDTKTVVSPSIPPPPPEPLFVKSNQDLLHKKFTTLSSELNERLKNKKQATTLVSGTDKPPSQDGEVAPKEHSTELLILGGDHNTVAEHKKEEIATEEKEEAPVSLQRTKSDETIDAGEKVTLIPLEEDQLPEYTEEQVKTTVIIVNEDAHPEVAVVTEQKEGETDLTARPAESLVSSRASEHDKTDVSVKTHGSHSDVTSEAEEINPLIEEVMTESSGAFSQDIEYVDYEEDEPEGTEENKYKIVPGEHTPNPESAHSTEKSHDDADSLLLDPAELSDTTDAELDPANKVPFRNPATVAMGMISDVAADKVLPFISRMKNRFTKLYSRVNPYLKDTKALIKKIAHYNSTNSTQGEETKEEPTEKIAEGSDYSEEYRTASPYETEKDTDLLYTGEEVVENVYKLDPDTKLISEEPEAVNDDSSLKEGSAISNSPPTKPATPVGDTKEDKPVEPSSPAKKKIAYTNAQIRKTNANALVNKLTHLRKSDSTDTKKAEAPKEEKQSTGGEKDEEVVDDEVKTIIKISLLKSELIEDKFLPSSLALLALISMYNIIN